MALHAFQSEMYNFDTETLLEESIGTSQSKSPKFCQPRLGKRGLEWRDKLLIDISLRIRITRLKFLGKTKEEITHEEPGYYYDTNIMIWTRNFGIGEINPCQICITLLEQQDARAGKYVESHVMIGNIWEYLEANPWASLTNTLFPPISLLRLYPA